jgi:Ca-activated chloride channel family protein
MRRLRQLGLLVGLWTMCTSAAPQQRVEPPPVLSIKTDLVTLPVTVVDRRGRLVTGLRQEHFTVYDNAEPQTIQFFSDEDVPATIGLVIDASGSMRGRREAVTAAGSAFASLSHPLDEFFTVNFNESVWPGLPASLAFAEDANQLRAALAAAPARGMTALYDAIDFALDHLQRGTRDRKALIVVSDGDDNASWHDLDGVVARARATNAVIYAVTLVEPDNHDAKPQVLKELARETGGRAFRPGRTDDVMPSFIRIAREIRSGYTIGFSPPETRDGGFHAVRVVADAGDGRQLIARTRAGYHAGPPARPAR